MQGDVQESKRENQDNGELGPVIHPQLPHKEDGQDAKHPICQRAHDGVCICHSRENGIMETCPVGVLIARPEVGDGRALEEQEEEVHGAEDEHEDCVEVDDGALVAGGGQADVEGCYRELRDCGGDDIEEFANKCYLLTSEHISCGLHINQDGDMCIP